MARGTCSYSIANEGLKIKGLLAIYQLGLLRGFDHSVQMFGERSFGQSLVSVARDAFTGIPIRDEIQVIEKLVELDYAKLLVIALRDEVLQSARVFFFVDR